jgi:Uma2 family endonuclease
LKKNIEIMELTLDTEKRYTYADYLTWSDGKRRELVHGFIRMITVPDEQHQNISLNLSLALYGIITKYFKGECKMFYSPFDVRLPNNDEKEDHLIDTVVQPDVCVVYDHSKLDEKGCLGVPDYVAEIQSPTTAGYNLNEKFTLYETVGVREYWIISPVEQTVQVFILQPNGKYDKGTLYETGEAPVYIFENIKIHLKFIFQ